MDEAARVVGLSPAEIRRRNFIKPEQMPYKTRDGQHLRHRRVRRAHGPGARRGRRGRRSRRGSAESRAQGPHPRPRLRHLRRGLRLQGTRSRPRPCSRRTARSAVHIGTQSTGQGHQTAYAQFVAGPLGLDYDKIRVVQGDTDALPTGGGTGGSRSIPLGAPSVDRASRHARRADQGSSPPTSLRPASATSSSIDGTARVVGTDRSLSYAEIARRAKDKTQAHRDRRVQGGGADLSERHACLRGRDRSGDRPHRGRPLHDRRRFRRDGEPDAARRAGAWRRGAGDRPGAARAHRLRRRRPAHHRDLQRLRHAARRRLSVLRLRDAQRSLQMERARHQGRRRGRHDRRHAGGDERRRRRAAPRLRHPQHRHAGDAAPHLGGDPGGAC